MINDMVFSAFLGLCIIWPCPCVIIRLCCFSDFWRRKFVQYLSCFVILMFKRNNLKQCHKCKGQNAISSLIKFDFFVSGFASSVFDPDVSDPWDSQVSGDQEEERHRQGRTPVVQGSMCRRQHGVSRQNDFYWKIIFESILIEKKNLLWAILIDKS